MAKTKAAFTTGEVHELFQALTAIDKDTVKLTGETRMAVAINLSRVTPLAAAYERARGRALADLTKKNREKAAKDQLGGVEIEAAFAELDVKLRASDADVKLIKLLKADLRLDENPALSMRAIGQLIPILDDVE